MFSLSSSYVCIAGFFLLSGMFARDHIEKGSHCIAPAAIDSRGDRNRRSRQRPGPGYCRAAGGASGSERDSAFERGLSLLPFGSRSGPRNALCKTEEVGRIVGCLDLLEPCQVDAVVCLRPVSQVGIDVVLVCLAIDV